MKKIVLFIDSLDYGGTQKNCISLANFLSIKYEVKIIVAFNSNIMNKENINKEIDIKFLNCKNKIDLFFKLQDKKLYKEISNIISFIPFISSVINFHKLFFKKNIPIISRCNNTLGEYSKYKKISILENFLKSLLYKYLFRLSNRIIAQSFKMKEDLIKTYCIPESKIIVINNSLDFKKIKFLIEEKITENEKKYFKNPTIIMVGRLVEQKNHIFLIEVINKLLKRKKEINLIILGDGTHKNMLLSKIKEYNLENNVFILGMKENPYKYIYNANFLWLASLYEGFPNVLLDAIACNKVIISNDCKSGPREIIAQNDNFIKKMNYFEEYKYGYLYSLTKIEEISEEFIDEVEDIIFNSIEKNQKIMYNYDFLKKIYSQENQLNKYLNLLR